MRLLDFNGRLCGLSEVAAQMLRGTLEQGFEAAAKRVSCAYDVPLDEVRADLANLLSDLEKRRLLRRVSKRSPAEWVLRKSSIAALVPLLWGVRRCESERAQAWLLEMLTWGACRTFGWLNTVEALYVGLPLGTTPGGELQTRMRSVDLTVRSVAASHWFTVQCKERALTTWGLARVAGVPAELVVGFHAFPLEGHCWCDYEGDAYSDDPERCAQFQSVWRRFSD